MKVSKEAGLAHRWVVSRHSSRFGEDFKRDAVRLVVDEKYTFAAAAASPRILSLAINFSLLCRVVIFFAAETPIVVQQESGCQRNRRYWQFS